ncbi:hypothetical protein [Streptomyces sp. NPDC003374]
MDDGDDGLRPEDDGPGHAGLAPEVLLVAALREGALDAAAEQRAVEAFRAARAEGVHRAARAARPRRRDDWRPHRDRRVRRSVKTTLAVVLASLTLGGVAVAAIGSAGSPHAGPDRGPRSSPSVRPSAEDDTSRARPTPAASSSGAPAAPPAPARPDTAADTAAHCRAYEQVRGRGKALDATAWQRLVTAAGGEDEVAAYCARRLERTAAGKGGTSGKAGAGTGTRPPAGNGAPGAGGGSRDTVPGRTAAPGKGGDNRDNARNGADNGSGDD